MYTVLFGSIREVASKTSTRCTRKMAVPMATHDSSPIEPLAHRLPYVVDQIRPVLLQAHETAPGDFRIRYSA